MAIKYDETPTMVTIYCTDCGHWRAFAWTRDEARRRAADHEERVHPDKRRARDRLTLSTRRAARAANVGKRAEHEERELVGSADREAR